MVSCVHPEVLLRGCGSEKDPFDAENSAVNECRQIAQRWKNMVAAHGQSASEKYAKACFALICDPNLSLPGGEFGGVLPRGSPLRKFKHVATLVFVANVPNPLKLHIGDKQSVLVLDIEPVQGPNGFAISSLVGLYDIHDEVNDPFRGLIYESASAIDGCYKFIPSPAYREIGVIRPLSSRSEFDVTGNEVQSSSEIMQSVSNDAHEFSWHGFTKPELERIVAGIKVSLNVNSVKVSLDEFAHEKTTQVLDVLLGPLDLYVRSGK
jgi:hypothetical protein